MFGLAAIRQEGSALKRALARKARDLLAGTDTLPAGQQTARQRLLATVERLGLAAKQVASPVVAKGLMALGRYLVAEALAFRCASPSMLEYVSINGTEQERFLAAANPNCPKDAVVNLLVAFMPETQEAEELESFREMDPYRSILAVLTAREDRDEIMQILGQYNRSLVALFVKDMRWKN